MAGQPKFTRSGGPKTQVGKVIASQNSLKAGAYSQLDLLPHEDAREHAALEQLFIEDLRPIGVVEFVLVQFLVKVAWKKLRLEKMETRILADCLAKLPSLSDLQKAGIENYSASSKPYVANPELIASLNAKEIRQAIWALEEFRQRGLREELLSDLESIFKMFIKN